MQTPSRATAKRALRALAVVGLVLVLAGCAKNGPQDGLKPAGPYAQRPVDLIKYVFIIAAVVFVAVQGMVLYCVLRFRRRSEDERPVQVHGNTKVELAGLFVTTIVLAGVLIPTIGQVLWLDKQPKDAMQVEVIGHQWWWEYNYMDSAGNVVARTANELHIPVGKKVLLFLTSGDVIHNFWPPKLAGKVYAIPGRRNHMVIQADKADFYYGQCAEYCGLSHANMRLRVVAQPQADFNTWLSAVSATTPSKVFEPVTKDNSATATPEQKGATLFLQKGCSGCHAINGISKGAVGPNLTYFNTRATFAGAIFSNTDENLRAWLRNPPAEKPGSLMPNLKLSEDDITSLIAYLRTLGDPSLRAVGGVSTQAAGLAPATPAPATQTTTP